MKEPTSNDLRAMAGWALTRRENASDAQVLALLKFRDGCEDLAENMPVPLVQPRVKERIPVATQRRERETVARPSVVPIGHTIPLKLLAAFADDMVKGEADAEACPHRFHIATQRCIFCGQTYLQAKGRQPELLGR